ncbi:PAS domain S-box protein [Puteibacter caeruleilacunae]|nr:PAS domain S-box protein [Puteibacter caeruleilacunae]
MDKSLTREQLLSRIKNLEEELLNYQKLDQFYENNLKRIYRLFEEAPLSYQSLDEKGYILEVNNTFLRTLGYNRDEIIGTWFGDLLTPEYRDKFKQRFEIFKERGEMNHVEFTIHKKDKTPIIVQYNGRIGYHPDGSFRQTHCVFEDITRTKYLERSKQTIIKKLEDQQFKYDSLLNNIEDGVFLFPLKENGLPGNFIEVNKAASKLLGYSEEELLQLSPIKLQINSTEKLIRTQLSPLFEKGTNNFHVEVYKKNNDIANLHLSSLLFNQDGDNYVLTIARDITQEVAYKKQLIESEKRFRLVLDDLKQIAIILDQEGKILFSNQFLSEITGYTKEELLGQKWIEIFITEEDKTRIGQIFTDIVNNQNVPLYATNYILTKKGKKRLITWSNSATIEDNKFIAITSIGEDITDKVKAEKALLREMKINRKISEISKEILHHEISIDRISSIVYEAARELTATEFGYVGIIDQHDQSLVCHTMTDIMDKCEVKNKDIRFHKGDDGYNALWGFSLNMRKPFFTNAPQKHFASKGIPKGHLPIKNLLSVPALAGGKLLGQIALANAPKEFRKKDLSVIQKIANIFALAIIRKQSEEQIVKEKQKAIKSDQLKSAFLANMSHEIRTPMNGLMGFIDLLHDIQPGDADYRRYINVVSDCSRQLLNIINDILDISKIEVGELKIFKENTDMHQVLNEVTSLAKSELLLKQKQHIDLKINFPQESNFLFLYTDQTRIKQVFTNLLNNAIKFTDEGAIEIGYYLPSPEEVVFFVKDTGVGIHSDNHHKIFDRFGQADFSITKTYGGTGLGLSIAKGIIELLGGKIWFDSTENIGTTFYISHPLSKRIPSGKIQTPQLQHTDFNWHDRTILIVEDDPASMEFLKTVLGKVNVNLVTTPSGKEALEIVKSKDHIDLILMDVRLPDISGYVTTKLIKAIQRDIPIFAQTAHAMPEDKERCLEAGCDEFISKPINLKELLSLIHKYFDN